MRKKTKRESNVIYNPTYSRPSQVKVRGGAGSLSREKEKPPPICSLFFQIEGPEERIHIIPTHDFQPL